MSPSCGASWEIPRGSGRCEAPATSSSRPEMRGGSLRSRLFWGIAVVVLICVALTIGVGLVLTQREVKKSALRDLAHQVDLIAAGQFASGKGLQPQIQHILNHSPQHEIFLYKRRDLPPWARELIAHHHPVQGTMD